MNEKQKDLSDKMIDLLATIRQRPDSAAGKKALNDFLTLCLQLPGLRRDCHTEYHEVLYDTLLWVRKNIQDFDASPNEKFLVNLKTWINGTLNNRIKELYKKPRYQASLDFKD